jgi:tripartite-type tricarboxylate transporter receptor subunit TctC
MVLDFAKTDEQRAALRLVLSSQDIGWPYMMATGVPPDRVEAMRSAFDATMKDPEFLADAAKRKLDVRPLGGEEQARLIDQTLATSPHVVELVKAIVGDQ